MFTVLHLAVRLIPQIAGVSGDVTIFTGHALMWLHNVFIQNGVHSNLTFLGSERVLWVLRMSTRTGSLGVETIDSIIVFLHWQNFMKVLFETSEYKTLSELTCL